MKIDIYIPNAIIFVYDYDNSQVEIPAYIETELVSYNDTCISIATLPDVEGKATIELSKNMANKDIKAIMVFKGTIETPNKNVVVSTSEEEGVLKALVNDIQTNVSVWVDDTEFPRKIFIHCE
ncbi:MAG: hypothetical protein R3E90_14830 [Marinicella sp.]|nr:hypothetical protein [Xanthomonadales bacterium]